MGTSSEEPISLLSINNQSTTKMGSSGSLEDGIFGLVGVHGDTSQDATAHVKQSNSQVAQEFARRSQVHLGREHNP